MPENINSDTTKIFRFWGWDLEVSEENVETDEESIYTGQPKSIFGVWLILATIFVLICIFPLSSCSRGSSSSGRLSKSTDWSCIEFAPPYSVAFIDDEVDVFNGYDFPGTTVKGNLSHRMGGIEVRCNGSRGSFYFLVGTDWWGWVKISDTIK